MPPTPDPAGRDSALLHLLALVLLCGLMFGYGLDRLPLIGPDEPRYAEVAREMYDSGDWITPRLGGLHWFEKPALAYWLSAAGYAVFGVSEAASRVGIAALATLGSILLYLFGRRLGEARLGYLSGATLATTGLWVGFARGATFDLPLAVTTELALLAFFWWDHERRTEAGWWWCCFGVGLALLAKGLVGIVLPASIILLYLTATRRLHVLLKRPRLLLGGALIVIATAGVWYGPMLVRHGREFIDEFFIAHHLQRYLTDKYRHPQPFYFFFFVILAGSFPYLAYLLRRAWGDARRRSNGDDHRLRLFLWLWVLVPTLFFSFSGSKLPGYILPVFPAVALLVGLELNKWWSQDPPRSAGLATGALIALAAVLVGLFGANELGVGARAAWAAAGAALSVAAIYLVLIFARHGRAATRFLPFGLIAVVVVLAHFIFPGLARRESLRELSRLAVASAQPGERLVFYINFDHSLNFYAPALPLRDQRAEFITLMDTREIAALLRQRGERSLLVIAREQWARDLENNPGLEVEWLGRQDVSRRCSPGCDWDLLRVRSRSVVSSINDQRRIENSFDDGLSGARDRRRRSRARTRGRVHGAGR